MIFYKNLHKIAELLTLKDTAGLDVNNERDNVLCVPKAFKALVTTFNYIFVIL